MQPLAYRLMWPADASVALIFLRRADNFSSFRYLNKLRDFAFVLRTDPISYGTIGTQKWIIIIHDTRDRIFPEGIPIVQGTVTLVPHCV